MMDPKEFVSKQLKTDQCLIVGDDLYVIWRIEMEKYWIDRIIVKEDGQFKLVDVYTDGYLSGFGNKAKKYLQAEGLEDAFKIGIKLNLWTKADVLKAMVTQ